MSIYTSIETKEQLDLFYQKNKDTAWLGFDTEFVGEKRFETLLCLIQVVTSEGVYIIDPLVINDISPFLTLLEKQDILKITHAGENDYRVFYNSYGILPKNAFDTQIAAGFIGYSYPISFVKLVERELGMVLDKTYTVADWESRPLNQDQILYALNDVIPLPKLWQQLDKKVKELERTDWLKEELMKMEDVSAYIKDPVGDAIYNPLIRTLKTQKQVFLIRLNQWRYSEAKRKNYSLDMILPAKWIATIVKQIDSGKKAMLNNRVLPKWIAETYWEKLSEMYKTPATAQELELIKKIPQIHSVDTKQQLDAEMLYLLIKYKCFDSRIAPELVINKSDLSYSRPDDLFPEHDSNWRKAFLGYEMVNWLDQKKNLQLTFETDKIIVTG